MMLYPRETLSGTLLSNASLRLGWPWLYQVGLGNPGKHRSEGHRHILILFSVAFVYSVCMPVSWGGGGGVRAHECSTLRVQKMATDLTKLELQVAVNHPAWVLGTKL